MNAGKEQGRCIWMDGRMVPWNDATLHFASNSFQYGFSVFEGIRAYKTAAGAAVFRLDAHITRLFRSAKIIGLEIPFSPAVLLEASCDTVAANEYEQCYIRPVAYIGEGGMDLDHRNCRVNDGIAAWFWGEYHGEGKLE